MAATRLSPRDPPVSAGDRQLLGLHPDRRRLRMLVVLYFHGLGYSPLAIASLFLFYEIFGVVTNLVGAGSGLASGSTAP